MSLQRLYLFMKYFQLFTFNSGCFFCSDLKDAVHLLAISKCKKYVVAGDHDSNIAVWKGNEVSPNRQTFVTTNFTNGVAVLLISFCVLSLQYYCSLPKAKSHPTALAIHPGTNDVVVTYANQKVTNIEAVLPKFRLSVKFNYD